MAEVPRGGGGGGGGKAHNTGSERRQTRHEEGRTGNRLME